MLNNLPRVVMVLAAVLFLSARPAYGQPPPKGELPEKAEARQTLTVAVVSSHSRFADVDGNLKHFEKLIGEAAGKGARLVCFPELALVSFSSHKDVLKAAEPIPGPASKKLEAIARAHKVHISIGMAEKDGDKHHITQLLVGPDGYQGKYRKRYPTNGEQACGFAPGDAYSVWNVDDFRLGFLICADGRQQDTIEAMKQLKVDLIHHPHGNIVGWLGREAEEWTRSKMTYFVPRAVHARAYILINNSAGDTEGPDGKVQRFSSGALVLDPLGQVVQRSTAADRSEKMILVTVVRPLSQLIPEGELRRIQGER